MWKINLKEHLPKNTYWWENGCLYPKTGIKTKISPLFKIILKTLAITIMQKKEIKGAQVGKEEIQLSLVAQRVKNPPAMWEISVQSLHWEDPLEKWKATHASTLAWRIQRTVIVHGVAESRIQLSLSLLFVDNVIDCVETPKELTNDETKQQQQKTPIVLCVSCSVMSEFLWPNGLFIGSQAPLSTEFSRQEYWSR